MRNVCRVCFVVCVVSVHVHFYPLYLTSVQVSAQSPSSRALSQVVITVTVSCFVVTPASINTAYMWLPPSAQRPSGQHRPAQNCVRAHVDLMTFWSLFFSRWRERVLQDLLCRLFQIPLFWTFGKENDIMVCFIPIEYYLYVHVRRFGKTWNVILTGMYSHNYMLVILKCSLHFPCCCLYHCACFIFHHLLCVCLHTEFIVCTADYIALGF